MFEGGGAILASSDPQRLAAEVARLAPADAANLPRFMADNRAKLAAFRPILESPFHSPLHLLRPDVVKSLAMLRPHVSVDGDLARYFSDERVRLAFSFQAKYLGMSPFRCPSLFTILSFMEYEFGVFHPRGGCGAVMERMADIARDLGAQIRLGEPVQEILFHGRRATGLRTQSGTQHFDALVINADFAQTMTKLVPTGCAAAGPTRSWRRRNTPAPPSCSISASRARCRTWRTTTSCWPPITAATWPRSKLEKSRPASRPSTCRTPPSPTTTRATGCSTLYVLAPVGNRVGAGLDWAVEKSRYRALLLKRLEKLGITDIERRIRFEHITTPTDWEDEMDVYRGATFNLAHSLRQMPHLRPHKPVRRPRWRLSRRGGGTHPGSGLPVIFESARITTKLLAKDLGLSPQMGRLRYGHARL